MHEVPRTSSTMYSFSTILAAPRWSEGSTIGSSWSAMTTTGSVIRAFSDAVGLLEAGRDLCGASSKWVRGAQIRLPRLGADTSKPGRARAKIRPGARMGPPAFRNLQERVVTLTRNVRGFSRKGV
jgi:hypothetical protein